MPTAQQSRPILTGSHLRQTMEQRHRLARNGERVRVEEIEREPSEKKMGIYYDAATTSTTRVFINISTGNLANLGCLKSPGIFIRDFIERNPAISRLAIFLALNAAPAGTSSDKQLHLLFENPTDVAAMRQGMQLEWIDCYTSFIDVTPNAAANVHLILTVSAKSTVIAAAQQVPHSLLV